MLKFINNTILISSITTFALAGQITTDGSMGAASTLSISNTITLFSSTTHSTAPLTH